MFHQNIRLPGIYIFNSIANTRGLQGAPIYSSMPDVRVIGMNDSDNAVLVYPKYKIILYTNINYGGTSLTIDNTNGLKHIFTTGLNAATSWRVYYDNIEIEYCFSDTGY
jgi:hypothetical protein